MNAEEKIRMINIFMRENNHNISYGYVDWMGRTIQNWGDLKDEQLRAIDNILSYYKIEEWYKKREEKVNGTNKPISEAS